VFLLKKVREERMGEALGGAFGFGQRVARL